MRKPGMHTAERRRFYRHEQIVRPEGELEHCKHCDRLSDPLDSLSTQRRHRTGRCVS